MRRMFRKSRIILFIILLAMPVPALADNCSGLFDCFGNMRAAAAAAVGLSIFGALVSMGLDFIPFVGTIKGGIEAFTGRDLITGDQLSPLERALGVLPFVGGLASAATAGRALDKVADALRAADKITDAGRAADKAGDVVKAADNIADAGRALDKTSDAGKGATKAADDVADAATGAGKNKVPKEKCTNKGEPVDVASGREFSNCIDFELPGPFRLKWERTWYSDSRYTGPLGHGWHHSYDMALWTDDKDGTITVRLWDGREVEFVRSDAGKKIFNRKERLELSQADKGYVIWSLDNRLHYHFSLVADSKEWKLVKIESSDRHAILLQYDTKNLLSKMIDSAGREIKIDYNEDSRIVSIHVPDPQKSKQSFAAVTYTYDPGTKDLIKATDAINDSNLYEYQNHLLVKRILKNGFGFYFEYDAQQPGARCIRTWGDGNFFAYSFQYLDEKTIVTNSLGHITTYTHRSGLVTSETNSRGAVRRFDYNSYNELIAEHDPYNKTTSYRYDERGNKISVEYPDGASVVIVFNDDLPVKGKDLTGNEWQWVYDEKGNLTKRILPTGHSTKYEYANGLLSVYTDPAGNRTHYNYDNEYNLKDTITPDGAIRSWLYDNLGRCIKYTDARGNEQWISYDLKNRVVQVNEPDGNMRQYTYDGIDNLLSIKDREKDIRFKYTQVNSLSERNEGGASVTFRYDTEGNMVDIINQQGDLYKFILNEDGDVITETGFDGRSRHYTRDLSGRITETLLPNDTITRYEYDVMNRLSRILYADDENTVYKYDTAGYLIEARNNYSTNRIEYDVLGRKIKETDGDHTLHSEYDVLNNRIRITSDMDADIRFGYNNIGNMQTIDAGNWQARMQHDQLGLELLRTLPGNIRHEWKRDKLDRPVSQQITVKDQVKRTRQYQWQINEKLEQITDSNYGLSKFGYDALGNLSDAMYNDAGKVYRIADKVNNYYRTPQATDRKYDKAGRLLESDAYSYTYDTLGNLVEKRAGNGATWKYRWYASGMLKEIQRPDGESVTFQYDALGRRVAKQTSQKNTRWVWDGNTPFHEFTESRLGKDKVDDLITWLFEENNLNPAAKLTAGQSYSLINDHLGTPLEMYDTEGEKKWGIELDIYGDRRNLEGSLTDCPFRYKGQYEDEETGLYYNRFRYYDPESGNYISEDPIGLAGNNPTLYSYVSNPNNSTDPFGLQPIPLDEGGYSVYALVDKITKIPYYVGISNDEARRLGEHIESNRFNPKKHEMVTLEKDLKFREARGYEQAYMEHYGTKTGKFNKPISPRNRGNKVDSFDKTRTDKRGKAFKNEYDKAVKDIKGVCP